MTFTAQDVMKPTSQGMEPLERLVIFNVLLVRKRPRLGLRFMIHVFRGNGKIINKVQIIRANKYYIHAVYCTVPHKH